VASFRTGWQSLLASMNAGSSLDGVKDGLSEDQALTSTAATVAGSAASLPAAPALTATIPFLAASPVAGQTDASTSADAASAAKLAQTVLSTESILQRNAAFLAGQIGNQAGSHASANFTVSRATTATKADSSRESSSSHSARESKHQAASSDTTASVVSTVTAQVPSAAAVIVQPTPLPVSAGASASSTTPDTIVASESTPNVLAGSTFASMAGDYSLSSNPTRTSGARASQAAPTASVAAVSGVASEDTAEGFGDRTTSNWQGRSNQRAGAGSGSESVDELGSANERFLDSSSWTPAKLSNEQSQTLAAATSANTATSASATVAAPNTTTPQPLSARQWSALQSSSSPARSASASSLNAATSSPFSAETAGISRSRVDETAPRALLNKLPFNADTAVSSPTLKETTSAPANPASDSKAPTAEVGSSSQIAANPAGQDAAYFDTQRQNQQAGSTDLTSQNRTAFSPRSQNQPVEPEQNQPTGPEVSSSQNTLSSSVQAQGQAAGSRALPVQTAATPQEQTEAGEAQITVATSPLPTDSNTAVSNSSASMNTPSVSAKSSPTAGGGGARKFSFSTTRAVPQPASANATQGSVGATGVTTSADNPRTQIQNDNPSTGQNRNGSQRSNQASATKAENTASGSVSPSSASSNGSGDASTTATAKLPTHTASMTAQAGSAVASTVSSADAAAAEEAASTRSDRATKQTSAGTAHGAVTPADGGANLPAQTATGTLPPQGTAQAHDLSAARGTIGNSVHGASGNSTGESESTTSKTFAALDAEPTTQAPSWIRAGAQQAEAGYKDPELGWVGVRADASGGGVHASLVPGSADASATLGSHLDGLNAYLTEHHTPIETITVAAPESRSMGQGTGLDLGQGSHQQMSQGNGQGAQESQQAALEMGSNLGSGSGQSSGQGASAEQYVTSQTVAPAAATASSSGMDGNTSESVEAAGSNGVHISVVA